MFKENNPLPFYPGYDQNSYGDYWWRPNADQTIKQCRWFPLVTRRWPRATVYSFKSLVGCDKPYVLDYMYNNFLAHNGVSMEEYFNFRLYPNLYCTEDALHAMCHVSKETYRTKKAKIKRCLTSKDLVKDYRDYIIRNVDLPYRGRQGTAFADGAFFGQIDTVECPLEKPVDFSRSSAIYSGYKATTTLKYQVISSFNKGIPLFIDGPFPGPRNDSRCYKESKGRLWVEEKFKNMYLIGDSKYSKWKQIYTPKNFRNDTLVKQLCGKRSIVEHLMSRFKNFKILSSPFREKEPNKIKKHKNWFKLIANEVFVGTVLSPLRR